MAEVVLATASEKQVWITNFLREYVRVSGFAPYMRPAARDGIFKIFNELKNEGGVAINVPLITRLKGRGVRGAEVLKGNEDDMGNFNDQVRIDWLRNAVKVPKSTSFRTEIDLLDAARDGLRTWDAEILRDDIIAALRSVIIPGAADINGIAGTDTAISYELSSAGQKNTFLANNSDRILFGNARSNSSSLNWATSLGNVSAATGRPTAGTIGLLKRLAKTAGQATNSINIRPYQTDATAGRDWFVLFIDSYGFRDLNADPTIVAANTNARAREGDGMERNPIFQGGDLIYDGVIIREIPELTQYTAGTGSGGVNTNLAFLCGLSAIAIAYGQDPNLISDTDEDYKFRPAVAIEELRGQKKISYSGRQYGVVELVHASVADA